MQNDTNISIDSLKKLSKELDEAGYYSFLLPFHSLGSDQLLKAAHVLDLKQKIKYMIAMRPYHVSPQYFRMLILAFNEIQPGRLIINIIAGDGRSDEPNQLDYLGNSENLINVEQRKEYVRKLLSIYNEDGAMKYYLGETIISGFSDYSVETAKIFEYTTLCMYDEYFNSIDRLKDCKRRMVSAKVYLRDTEEEAEEIYSLAGDNTRLPGYTFYGTEDTALKKIQHAIDNGITDFLIGSCDFDKEKHRIHNFIKNIKHNFI